MSEAWNDLDDRQSLAPRLMIVGMAAFPATIFFIIGLPGVVEGRIAGEGGVGTTEASWTELSVDVRGNDARRLGLGWWSLAAVFLLCSAPLVIRRPPAARLVVHVLAILALFLCSICFYRPWRMREESDIVAYWCMAYPLAGVFLVLRRARSVEFAIWTCFLLTLAIVGLLAWVDRREWGLAALFGGAAGFALCGHVIPMVRRL